MENLRLYANMTEFRKKPFDPDRLSTDEIRFFMNVLVDSYRTDGIYTLLEKLGSVRI